MIDGDSAEIVFNDRRVFISVNKGLDIEYMLDHIYAKIGEVIQIDELFLCYNKDILYSCGKISKHRIKFKDHLIETFARLSLGDDGEIKIDGKTYKINIFCRNNFIKIGCFEMEITHVIFNETLTIITEYLILRFVLFEKFILIEYQPATIEVSKILEFSKKDFILNLCVYIFQKKFGRKPKVPSIFNCIYHCDHFEEKYPIHRVPYAAHILGENLVSFWNSKNHESRSIIPYKDGVVIEDQLKLEYITNGIFEDVVINNKTVFIPNNYYKRIVGLYYFNKEDIVENYYFNRYAKLIFGLKNCFTDQFSRIYNLSKKYESFRSFIVSKINKFVFHGKTFTVNVKVSAAAFKIGIFCFPIDCYKNTRNYVEFYTEYFKMVFSREKNYLRFDHLEPTSTIVQYYYTNPETFLFNLTILRYRDLHGSEPLIPDCLRQFLL